MRVNPNSGPTSVTQASPRPTGQPPSLGQDKLALNAANALNNALDQTPAVRPDKVAQAQSLISDKTYPPDEVIDGISKLLGAKIAGQKPSDGAH